MLALCVLSLLMAFLDVRYSALEPVHRLLEHLVTPVYWITGSPARIAEWTSDAWTSEADFAEENAELRTRLLVLEARTQRLASITAELNRVRELMHASSILDDSVLVAEIVGVNPDPYLHEVVINKGFEQGSYVGQPVLDRSGLMGQITAVEANRSRALLISDSSHAVPVQVTRNGIRGLLVGIGSLNTLLLINMPDTADVQEKDRLVTSGLGGRFPPGYPVAEVTRVRHDPGQPFATITAQPLAELNRSRNVLLVFKREPPGESAASVPRDHSSSSRLP